MFFNAFETFTIVSYENEEIQVYSRAWAIKKAFNNIEGFKETLYNKTRLFLTLENGELGKDTIR